MCGLAAVVMKLVSNNVSDPVQSEVALPYSMAAPKDLSSQSSQAQASASNEILGSEVYAFSDLETANMRGIAIRGVQSLQRASLNSTLTHTPPGVHVHKKPILFPFLKLPPEVRVKIYALCLCDYEEIEARLRVPDPTPSPQPVRTFILRHHKKPGTIRTQDVVYPGRFLALLRVDRKIYKEALPVFYSRTIFAFSDPRDLCLFAGSLAKRRRDKITRIRVPAGFDVVGDCTVWDMLQGMKGLEQVVVFVPKRLWDAWGWGKPTSESLYSALATGVVLVVRIVACSSDYGEERVVREWVCRKGLERPKKIENGVGTEAAVAGKMVWIITRTYSGRNWAVTQVVLFLICRAALAYSANNNHLKFLAFLFTPLLFVSSDGSQVFSIYEDVLNSSSRYSYISTFLAFSPWWNKVR